jgi:hypothetical protein
MKFFLAILLICTSVCLGQKKHAGPTVLRTDDFKVSGSGTSTNWQKAEWIDLTKRNQIGNEYSTRCKLLHSDTGLYFLYECDDKQITSTIREDFGRIFDEDAVEVLIWPDEASTLYLEYELSPSNHELVLLVPNFDGEFLGWRPWRYEGARKVRHATSTEDESEMESWTAEFFIPFALLKPLQNVPPKPGSYWRINLFRADFDSGERAVWSWKNYHKRFHDYKSFGYIYFAD